MRSDASDFRISLVTAAADLFSIPFVRVWIVINRLGNGRACVTVHGQRFGTSDRLLFVTRRRGTGKTEVIIHAASQGFRALTRWTSGSTSTYKQRLPLGFELLSKPFIQHSGLDVSAKKLTSRLEGLSIWFDHPGQGQGLTNP